MDVGNDLDLTTIVTVIVATRRRPPGGLVQQPLAHRPPATLAAVRTRARLSPGEEMTSHLSNRTRCRGNKDDRNKLGLRVRE